MIETLSGNSYAQQGEREFQSRGRCPACKAHDWEDVEMCEFDEEKVCKYETCTFRTEALCKPKFKIKCRKCGNIEEERL